MTCVARVLSTSTSIKASNYDIFHSLCNCQQQNHSNVTHVEILLYLMEFPIDLLFALFVV